MSLDPVKCMAAGVVVVVVWGTVEHARQDPRDMRPTAVKTSSTASYVPGSLIETGDPAWDYYQHAQKDWQKEVQDLISRRRPDLQAASAATLDMHWSLLDLRGARLRYLLAEDPGRITRDRGVRAFLSFSWDPQNDTSALQAWDPTFAQLQAAIEHYYRAAREHPDYASSREFLTSTLLLDAEYREILERFTAASEVIERMLQQQQ